jgi:hypothetical protein
MYALLRQLSMTRDAVPGFPDTNIPVKLPKAELSRIAAFTIAPEVVASRQKPYPRLPSK